MERFVRIDAGELRNREMWRMMGEEAGGDEEQAEIHQCPHVEGGVRCEYRSRSSLHRLSLHKLRHGKEHGNKTARAVLTNERPVCMG